MESKQFNIYLTGVGGQGIGMLSEILLRAADHAGLEVKAVDTHGLAQRGGIVVSQVRLGKNVNSPLIQAGRADLVIALERHEALRAIQGMLRPEGTAIYYDTVWQPLEVRLGKAKQVSRQQVEACAKDLAARLYRVQYPKLVDTRMQNVVVLSYCSRLKLVPGIAPAHFEQAMKDLMEGRRLEANLYLFRTCGDGD